MLYEEQDFYLVMWKYLLRCRESNTVHAEIMFDPQSHTSRGVGFEIFMPGFRRAMEQAREEWG